MSAEFVLIIASIMTIIIDASLLIFTIANANNTDKIRKIEYNIEITYVYSGECDGTIFAKSDSKSWRRYKSR